MVTSTVLAFSPSNVYSLRMLQFYIQQSPGLTASIKIDKLYGQYRMTIVSY